MIDLLSGEDFRKGCGTHAGAATSGGVAGETGNVRSCVTELTIPFPPSVNGYWRAVNGRQIISAKGREYRAAIMALAVSEKWPAFETSRVRVEIEAWMPDARRRDIDNLVKAPLDALTHAGLWEDDSQIDDLRIHRAPLKGGMLKILVEAL